LKGSSVRGILQADILPYLMGPFYQFIVVLFFYFNSLLARSIGHAHFQRTQSVLLQRL